MNLNAAFVHNYPLLHTYFIAIFLLFLILHSSKQIGGILALPGHQEEA